MGATADGVMPVMAVGIPDQSQCHPPFGAVKVSRGKWRP